MKGAALRTATLLLLIAIAPTAPYCLQEAFRRGGSRINSNWRRCATPIQLASSDSRNLSASARERREEDQRRRERAKDVVIGKTSAKDGASDFSLDVRSTEEQWMQQASPVEQEIYKKTEKGMEMLKMLRIEEAEEYFNDVFELKPDAYLWQAGIAKYYLNDLEGAADVFARCAATYESRFGEPASEERIWRHACGLKLLSSMSRKDRKLVEEKGGIDTLLTVIPEKENTDELLRSERRKVIRITRDLFFASVEKDHTAVILSRAKLRSIGGAFDERPRMDRKMWKVSSWYYLGLHFDSLGETEESKKCMKMALQLCPSGNGSDIIHTLPMLHMSKRQWFDDDELEAEKDDGMREKKSATVIASSLPGQQSASNLDPVLVESIKSSLVKLRREDLQEALRRRGLSAVGSKEELRDRLFRSLMSDTGLMP
jgi:tetratricopeptide (TPR) repeat protein